MLAEVKRFSERQLPPADLDAFAECSDTVCSMDAALHDSAVAQKLVAMLPSFQDDGLDFEEDEVNSARYKEKLSALASWFEKVQPDFCALASEFTDAVKAATPTFTESAKLEEYAQAFPPTKPCLPESCDDSFLFNCALIQFRHSQCQSLFFFNQYYSQQTK